MNPCTGRRTDAAESETCPKRTSCRRYWDHVQEGGPARMWLCSDHDEMFVPMTWGTGAHIVENLQVGGIVIPVAQVGRFDGDESNSVQIQPVSESWMDDGLPPPECPLPDATWPTDGDKIGDAYNHGNN